MSFHELFTEMQADTARSLAAFMPELALSVTIVLLLVLRLSRWTRLIPSWLVALAGAGTALWLAASPILFNISPYDGHALVGQRHELFTGLLVYDALGAYFRSLLMLFATLFTIFTRFSGIPDREDGADFYTLLLGSTLGMCLMATANHMLIVFLAVEMASVPSYAMAGLLKGRRQSSEAALKYAVYGAGAAGVMLYGISLLAGALGTVHIPTMAAVLADAKTSPLLDMSGNSGMVAALILGGLMVAVGVAFKLSAVPFHFWCPDVFEGATAEVNAFLSVASKAAALALLVRLVVGFGSLAPVAAPSSPAAADTAAISDGASQPAAPAVQLVALTEDAPGRASAPTAPAPAPGDSSRLQPVRTYLLELLTLLAAITCTFGNLAAYGQTNIKRLLAYSTIAHAGYLIMPVAAAAALMGSHGREAEAAIASLGFYITIYLFMNLGAFAVVAFLRNSLRSEEIADYAGLIKRKPVIVVLFSTIMLSLLGLPPLAGFAAKFAIFSSLIDASRLASSFAPELLGLVVIGGLNTVISLFYYLRVVKVMILDPEPKDRPPEAPVGFFDAVYLMVLVAPVVVFGVAWNWLYELARRVAEKLIA